MSGCTARTDCRAKPDQQSRQIDRKLIIGSAIFGMGWGLAGLCPGPVVASIGLDPARIFPFLAVMLIGLKLGGFVRARL